MTHHTDADLMHCPFCGGEAEAKKPDPSYEFTLIKCQECDAQTDERIDFVDAAEAWNRRAPAAPVPQGVVEPIDTVKYWRDAYANPQGDEHFMGHGMVVKIFDDYLGMLAAAPQPPEAVQSNSAEFDGIEKAAAPVQLPEPVAYLHECGKKPSLRTLEFSKIAIQLSAKGYKSHPLYTEQQVRELLNAAEAGNGK